MSIVGCVRDNIVSLASVKTGGVGDNALKDDTAVANAAIIAIEKDCLLRFMVRWGYMMAPYNVGDSQGCFMIISLESSAIGLASCLSWLRCLEFDVKILCVESRLRYWNFGW